MRRKEVASRLASPDRPISQIEGKASGETEDDSEE
jgi:hypothetical protein